MTFDKILSVAVANDYNPKYKQAINRFNISRLAWSSDALYEDKIGKSKPEYNMNMLVGKILGRYAQSTFSQDKIAMLRKLDFINDYQMDQLLTYAHNGWEIESRVEILLKFEWKNLELQNLTLSGKLDLLNRDLKQLIELKTPMFKSDVKDYAICQASLYWRGIKESTGLDYKAVVGTVHPEQQNYVLKPKDKMPLSNKMIDEAIKVAKMIDKYYA